MDKKAEKESRQISTATTSKGFTLIELMISIAIIAFVVAVGIPKLGRSTGSQFKAIARKIIVLNKELHHYARLKNKTYRLVMDFGDAEHAPIFYVESASGAQLADSPDASPTPSRKKGDDKKPKGPFSVDQEVLKKPISLPYGVTFEDVESETYPKPIKEGKAYIHFYPQGLVQRTIIHLHGGDKFNWSLIVNPLTADTTIRDEYVKLKDLQ
jgi:general secretion pathway protein H